VPPKERMQVTTAAIMPAAGHPACQPRAQLMRIPLDGPPWVYGTYR